MKLETEAMPENCYSKPIFEFFGNKICEKCQKLCNPLPTEKIVIPASSCWIDEAYHHFIKDAISST